MADSELLGLALLLLSCVAKAFEDQFPSNAFAPFVSQSNPGHPYLDLESPHYGLLVSHFYSLPSLCTGYRPL